MKQIPNVFTLLNLASGCLAVVFILVTGEGIMNYNGEEWKIFLPEKIRWGVVCIFVAAVIDFLDGFVARLFKASSEMGKQLDSLADIVSFGVAPGLIMFQLLRMAYATQPDGLDTSMALLLPALLIPLAAAWRLARFNTSPSNPSGFAGLPVPAAGIFIASLPMILAFENQTFQSLLLSPLSLYVIIALVSMLMVSRLPLLKPGIYPGGIRGNLPMVLLVVIAALTAVFMGWLALPAAVLAYIILSLIFKRTTP